MGTRLTTASAVLMYCTLVKQYNTSNTAEQSGLIFSDQCEHWLGLSLSRRGRRGNNEVSLNSVGAWDNLW